MAKPKTDPSSYLRSTVSKKGKSIRDGVYYPYPSVVFSASENFGYDWSNSEWLSGQNPVDCAKNCFNSNFEGFAPREDWNEVLVRLRKERDWCIESLVVFEGEHILEFLVEDHDISLRVIIPTLRTEDIDVLVIFYQSLLKEVANFSSKMPTNVRLSAGVALSSWEEMVGWGEAQVIDVGF